MKPFALYQTFTEHFTAGQQKLLQLLTELTDPDAVYLLGATLYRRRTESIFAPMSPTAQHVGDYFLLILINDAQNKPLYEWQDQIEQHLREYITVTVIVLETATFRQWLNSCHQFALTVMQTSVPIFKKGNVHFSLPTLINNNEQKVRQCFREGIARTRSFLAGAELYIVRKEYTISVFMLHQALEQALSTLIKTATGYHTHTHNIERLLRYASMFSYQLPDIFPQHTDYEKQLFRLLQKAYSQARYSELYIIHFKETGLLFERAKKIIDIVESFTTPINENSNS